MKSVIEIFSELGTRLKAIPDCVIERAIEQNSWFSHIPTAIDALCSELLDKEKITKWLSKYTIREHEPKRVAIIMAGNIPAVGFFDLMCVIASGNIPVVKYSSKDRVLMEYIVNTLQKIEPQLSIEQMSNSPIDAVIATGSDAAALHFKAAFGDIPALIRASRHSIAVITGAESEKEFTELSKDVFTHCSLGCRSVSLIFAPADFEVKLTLPNMPQCYKNNYIATSALMTMTGKKFTDIGGALLVESSAEFPRHLSCINICRYNGINEVKEWINTHRDTLQCVVSAEKSLPLRVDFGKAQYPGLTDYADDVDIMNFLLTL